MGRYLRTRSIVLAENESNTAEKSETFQLFCFLFERFSFSTFQVMLLFVMQPQIQKVAKNTILSDLQRRPAISASKTHL